MGERLSTRKGRRQEVGRARQTQEQAVGDEAGWCRLQEASPPESRCAAPTRWPSAKRNSRCGTSTSCGRWPSIAVDHFSTFPRDAIMPTAAPSNTYA